MKINANQWTMMQLLLTLRATPFNREQQKHSVGQGNKPFGQYTKHIPDKG